MGNNDNNKIMKDGDRDREKLSGCRTTQHVVRGYELRNNQSISGIRLEHYIARTEST